MNPQTAQLIAILAPVISQMVIDGTKIILEMRRDTTREELAAVIESARSATWPELDFGTP